ncbi:MAG: hypothetical protein JXR07_19230 [Reichenbachiella sp.]
MSNLTKPILISLIVISFGCAENGEDEENPGNSIDQTDLEQGFWENRDQSGIIEKFDGTKVKGWSKVEDPNGSVVPSNIPCMFLEGEFSYTLDENKLTYGSSDRIYTINIDGDVLTADFVIDEETYTNVYDRIESLPYPFCE